MQNDRGESSNALSNSNALTSQNNRGESSNASFASKKPIRKVDDDKNITEADLISTVEASV